MSVVAGFPDWQGGVTWLGTPYFAMQDVVLDGGGNFTAFTSQPNTSYRGVMVYVNAPPHSVWVRVVNIEAGGSHGGTGLQWEVYLPANSVASFAVDTIADLVSVQLHNGTAGDTVTIGARPTNLPTGMYGLVQNPYIYFDQTTVWIAGSGPNVDIPVPYFGRATAMLSNNAAGGRMGILIYTLDSTGATKGYPAYYYAAAAPAGGGSTPTTVDIWLPPGRNQVQTVNLSGGGSTFPVSILGHYLTV